MVKQSWFEQSNDFSIFRFAQKLIRLKSALQAWNWQKIGNIFDNVHMTENEVKRLELNYDSSRSEADLLQLNKEQAEFLEALVDEDQFWKQKARLRWLNDGDKNTSYFHTSVQEKRSRLHISKIKKPQGEWLVESDTIHNHARDFFSSLLSADIAVDDGVETHLLSVVPTVLTKTHKSNLLKSVMLKEVKEAVFSLDPDSARGQDGFPGSCYHASWKIISEDLLLVVLELMVVIPLPKVVSIA